MAKVRVYQLAKEIGLSNTEVVEKLKALNIDVKNHMSSLSEGEAEQVRSALTQRKEVKIDEIRIKPNVIRRRRKVEVKPPPEEILEPERPRTEIRGCPAGI